MSKTKKNFMPSINPFSCESHDLNIARPAIRFEDGIPAVFPRHRLRRVFPTGSWSCLAIYYTEKPLRLSSRSPLP